MTHPMKKEGVVGHNDKLKRMTRDYGAANSSMYKTAKGNLKNGPQKDYGYGTEGEGEASSDRSDRPRRSSPANPIAAYKRGGRVHEREKAEARAIGGGVGVVGRADGGRVSRKGTTNVNIIVAPQAPQAAPGPVIPPTGIEPPKPPMAPPAPPPAGPEGPAGAPPGLAGALGAGGPMGGLPPGAMPPGAVPPGLVPGRKKGGRVHSDVKEDKAVIKSMVKDSALKPKSRQFGGQLTATTLNPSERRDHAQAERASRLQREAIGSALTAKEKGAVYDATQREGLGSYKARAAGGRMTAGAATGEGRLEKAEMRRKSGDKTAEV